MDMEFVSHNTMMTYDTLKVTMEAVNGMISISEELFPGLMGDGKDGTGLYEYNHGSNTFNQKLSPACVLTEFGTDLNTAQEAKLSAKYLARVIAEYLNK